MLKAKSAFDDKHAGRASLEKQNADSHLLLGVLTWLNL